MCARGGLRNTSIKTHRGTGTVKPMHLSTEALAAKALYLKLRNTTTEHNQQVKGTAVRQTGRSGCCYLQYYFTTQVRKLTDGKLSPNLLQQTLRCRSDRGMCKVILQRGYAPLPAV